MNLDNNSFDNIKEATMRFIGRKEELLELNERFISEHFEMGVVYETRRIEKTSLLIKIKR